MIANGMTAAPAQRDTIEEKHEEGQIIFPDGVMDRPKRRPNLESLVSILLTEYAACCHPAHMKNSGIHRFHCFLFTTLVLISELAAADWPQWRGTAADGISTESGLPVQWSASQHTKWKVVLAGLGTSSPVTWGDYVFVTSQEGMVPVQGAMPPLAKTDPDLAKLESPIGGRVPKAAGPNGKVFLIVEAFRKSDGSRLWKYSTPATGEFPQLHEKHNLATPTPVTDGKLVYAWFGNGQVVALDMGGRAVWTRHLGIEYGTFKTPWGHGGSPILYRDALILLCDHAGNAYLLALDKNTGKERWKVDRGKERISHSTPLVVPGPGRDELIINSSERIDAYNPQNGELLWYTGSQRQTPIPSPVFHDGIIYLSRGYRNSDFLAIRPGGQGDVSEKNIVWRAASGASYVPSILYYEGLVYVTNEVGVVTCADAANGQPVWRLRLGGIFFASPVAGDGKVYMVSETGETFVLRAGRKAELLARNELGERMLASPAISDRHLFLRSDGTLFCIGD
jgi:outer membrane protein assembly factor BamB